MISWLHTSVQLLQFTCACLSQTIARIISGLSSQTVQDWLIDSLAGNVCANWRSDYADLHLSSG